MYSKTEIKKNLHKHFSSFEKKPVDFDINDDGIWSAVYSDGSKIASFHFCIDHQTMYRILGI